MGILKTLFGQSLPEVGEVVHLKESGKTGVISEVRRNGFGVFESFATCRVSFYDGAEEEHDERELVRHR